MQNTHKKEKNKTLKIQQLETNNPRKKSQPKTIADTSPKKLNS